MDYLGEVIALGIDSIIFGICLKQYCHYKNAITSVKGAEFHDVGENISKILKNSPNNKIGYIAIRGAVQPIGRPLQSVNKKDITGVIQKLTVKEHVVARTSAGFWSDQEQTMQEVYNSVPFVLQRGSYRIEVIDAMAADILDMDTVSDLFEPSVPTFTDYVWGFFTGVRQRGLQSTEEMLREGSVITGIGELSASKTDSPVLEPPLNGTPFYLTTMSVSSLLRKLDDRRRIYRWLCTMFGVIGLFIGVMVFKRYWKDRTEQRLEQELRLALAASRKERRQRVRDEDLPEEQLCVVCRTNPREIILLPCGHVCLCEDCSDELTTTGCPICRGSVAQKAAAYF